MFNREKVQKQLEQVQGKATARVLDIDEIAHMVAISEQETENMPKWILRYLIFEYVEMVPNAYSYTAQATRVQFDFTQKGTIKTIKLDRVNARSQAYGGYIKRFVLNVDAMALAEYDIEYGANSLLVNRLTACYGFNHQGTLSKV